MLVWHLILLRCWLQTCHFCLAIMLATQEQHCGPLTLNPESKSWYTYRLVRTDIDKASTSRSSIEWDNVIPQHPEDLMQWATALKVMLTSAVCPAPCAHRDAISDGAAYPPHLGACRRTAGGSSGGCLATYGLQVGSGLSDLCDPDLAPAASCTGRRKKLSNGTELSPLCL